MEKNILDKIIAHKRVEVEARKKIASLDALEHSPYFKRHTYSLKNFIRDKNKTGIIAEFKRKSPSKGIINDTATVMEVTAAYTAYGASGISVLTDEAFFGGNNEDLVAARFNAIPLLRKEFIIDQYQVTESRAIGADVILLIAACLTVAETNTLASYARKLGLEVLLEIHNEEELGHISDEIDLVGVNNRDLKTFSVDLNKSVELASGIPAGKLKIAESGINNIDNISFLKKQGFDGFLIGEYFMREKDPGLAFKTFSEAIKNRS